MSTLPKPKAKDDVLYWDDNGRVVCGEFAIPNIPFACTLNKVLPV